MESKTLISSIRENIGKVMVGSGEAIDLLLTALIAEGHVLIEDVPGMGKTVLAKSLAKSVSLEFNRIQFTPALLPSDVTGLNFRRRFSSSPRRTPSKRSAPIPCRKPSSTAF